jgi:hypothetical protein
MQINLFSNKKMVVQLERKQIQRPYLFWIYELIEAIGRLLDKLCQTVGIHMTAYEPYGFVKDKDKKLTPDGESSSIVKRIFDMSDM